MKIIIFIAIVICFALIMGCSDRDVGKTREITLNPMDSVYLSNGVQLVHNGIGVQPATSWLIGKFKDGRKQKIEGGWRYNLVAIKEIGDELHVKSTSWPPLAGRTSVYKIDANGFYEKVRVEDRFQNEIDWSILESIDDAQQADSERTPLRGASDL